MAGGGGGEHGGEAQPPLQVTWRCLSVDVVSVVSSEQWAALSTMETECYLVSDFSDICHPHARSGECILMIFKLPRMIIRVVQMRCEKFRYFGELLIILKHPNVDTPSST